MKEKLVAIKYDDLGKCEQLAIVKNVQDNEFKTLKNEANEHKQAELKKEWEKEQEINHLQAKISNHDLLLAKSIYDNFVDRGLLEDNAEFQQMFFELVMNHGAFDNQKFPSEFETILNYVRGL